MNNKKQATRESSTKKYNEKNFEQSKLDIAFYE